MDISPDYSKADPPQRFTTRPPPKAPVIRGIPYAPLGRVVAGGLVAGTVLTLFLVPFLYTVLDDVRSTASRWLAWVVARPRAAAAR
jgi:hypothetical protein